VLTQAGELLDGDIRPLLSVQASKRLCLGNIVAREQRDQRIGVVRFRSIQFGSARTTTMILNLLNLLIRRELISLRHWRGIE